MNYQKIKAQKRNKRFFIILFLIIIFVFAFFKISFINDFTREVSCSVCNVRSWLVKPFLIIKDQFVSKQSLIKQTEEQKNTIEDLKLDLLRQKISSIENQALYDSLREIENKENFVVSKVISRPPYSPYDTLTLATGFDGGLKEGQKVFSKGVFIGFIREVSANSSIVQLISSSKVESLVRIKNEIDATAIGMGGGALTISLPKDVKIEKGDVIYLPEITSSLVGVVSDVEQTNESFQTIYFNLPISLSKILFVEVMIK